MKPAAFPGTVVFVFLALALAGCSEKSPGGGAATGDASCPTHKDGNYIVRVHLDEGQDRVVVDDAQAGADWCFFDFLAYQGNVQFALNGAASGGPRLQQGGSADLAAHSLPIQVGDYVEVCTYKDGEHFFTPHVVDSTTGTVAFSPTFHDPVASC